MSESFERGLPQFDRTLLRCVGRVVPSDERMEWCRTWYERRSKNGPQSAA
jgi:hypothetical protein